MTESTAVEVHDKEVGGLPIARPEDLPEQFRDMAMTPEEAVKRREALLRFVSETLEEATYKDGGYPDRINDYYRVPGSQGLALSKRGAEKLGDLYRFKIAKSEIVDHKCEKDYCYARARVTLHRANIVVAEREGSASTAEKAFQRAAKKYGGDFRAADNDIVAKSQKRAYVQALIAALSATEILAAADDIPGGEAEEIKSERHPAYLTPELLTRIVGLTAHAQKADVLSAEDAEKFCLWIYKEGRTTEQLDKQLDLLEDRIIQAEEGPIK